MKASSLALYLLIRPLPLAALRALCWLVAELALLLAPKHKRLETLRTNLAWCFPHWPAKARRRLCRRALVQNGYLIADSLWVMVRGQPQIERRLQPLGPGLAELKAALLQNRKAGKADRLEPAPMAFFAHSCTTEIAPRWLASRASKLCVPYTANPRHSGPLEKLRRALYRKLAPAMTVCAVNRAGLRQLLTGLKAGAVLATAQDHVPKAKTAAHWVNFFGRKLCSPAMLPSLALRFGSACFPIATVRRFGRWQLWVEKPLKPSPKMGAKAFAQMLATCLERSIMRAPEQHTWTYRHFVKSGEPDLYDFPKERLQKAAVEAQRSF